MPSVLDSMTWGCLARGLLHRMSSLNPGRPAALHIRHTERGPATTNLDILKTPPTESGWLAAEEFGRGLPPSRRVRLHPTEIVSTRETAVAIKTGFESLGGRAELGAPIPVTPRLNPAQAQIYYKNVGGEMALHKFTLHWCAGMIPTNIYMPSIEFARRVAEFTSDNAASAEPDTLDIYVSHDMWISVFLFHWFGYPLNADTAKYLEGFTLQFNPTSMRVCYRDRVADLEYPYWWPGRPF